MADLKSTATSSYPATLDTFTTIVDADTRSAVTVNGLADALVKIETALGTSPHGTKQDVKTNLQIGHTTTGAHRQGFADSYSGLVSNTTSETSLATVDVSANTLTVAQNIRVTAMLNVSYVDAADTVTVAARYGDNSTMASATTCFSSGALTLTANTWSEQSNPKNFGLNGIIHGNNIYIAVGDADGADAYLITSTDGTTWTERTNAKNFSLFGVVYGSSLYVAVGNADGTDAYIVTSTDGTTWTERSNPKNFRLNSVTYGNSLYVAVGNADGTDAYIVTSTDGTTWTERSNPKNVRLQHVAYGGGLFVAVGDADGTDAYLVTSTDGTTWTERSNARNENLKSVVYGSSLYVAVGTADGTDAYLVTSIDGTTWTERSNPKNRNLNGVTYGNGLYVAVGAADGTDAYLVTSTDGTTWTERSNPKNFTLNGVTYGGNIHVAVGEADGTDAYLVTSSTQYSMLLTLDLYAAASLTAQDVFGQLLYGVATLNGNSEALSTGSVIARHYALAEDGAQTRRLWITITPSDAADISVTLIRLNAELYGV